MSNQNNHEENKEKDLLLAVYGKDSFMKIYQALEIDKIKFSFAKKGNETNGIDCYMNADDFASDLIAKIRNERLWVMLQKEKQRYTEAGEQYGKDVWESRIGNSSDNQLRSFSIQPGKNTPVVFRAKQDKNSITVGCDWRELELLAYRWKFLERDYERVLYERYTIANMKNSYRGNADKNESKNVDAPKNSTSASVTSVTNPTPANQPPMYESQDEAPTLESSSGTQQQTVTIRFKSIIPITNYKSGKCLKAITEEGDEFAVLFPTETINAIPAAQWRDFESKLQNTNTHFSCIGALANNKFYVKELCA